MIMGISISYISSVIIFDDLMLPALKTVFRIGQNNNVMNFIPNENANFVFEFSEFERFGSISHSLITVLFAWTHKKVYINMASINSKKREAGKLNKRCLTLDEKIKILDEVKKRKLSWRAIAEEFKIGKTQAANVVKNEAKLREEFENFQSKSIPKERITKNSNLLMTFFILGLKNVRLLVFM